MQNINILLFVRSLSLKLCS